MVDFSKLEKSKHHFNLFQKWSSTFSLNSSLRLTPPIDWQFRWPILETSSSRGTEHAINIEATDTIEQQWTFRLSIRRNDNPNPRPVFTGQWTQFVNEKGLKVGDRIVFSRQQAEGDGVQYRIRAERKIFNCWINVE
ncbi:hypothetical protein OIU78_010748 [Salix suchowensis]|nr:hypothetical protein OIU78_010748 [Salix suchowensis]